MGSSPLMSIGIKAMSASYAALQTTGHNIANASVQGYSRQSVGLATSEGQFTGAGFFGRGVDVVTVTRAHNEFLTREADGSTSLSAMDAARQSQLTRMETVFKAGEGGLGDAANQLFSALTDLSNNPSDLATRQVVLARVSDLAARFADAGSALDGVQDSVNADLKGSVGEVNGLAKSIAAINQRIAGMRGLGQPANDLLDERERLLSQLSSHVKVTRMEASDGTIGVFIGGGQRLVLGSDAAQLAVTQDPADPSRSTVSLVENGTPRALDENSLGGGDIAGLLRFQNNDLAAGRNLIGRMALALGSALNAQQQRGLDLGGQAGTALLRMGPSQALPNTANARNASGVPIGAVTLSITDATALQASDYDLRESTTTPGSWQLTRRSDGAVSTVNSGDVVDGMRIDISNAQPGDRFLLQPVTRAANGMTALSSNPRDLAAAGPLTAITSAANTGTASVAALRVTASPLPTPGGSSQVRFDSIDPTTGDYSISLEQFDAAGASIGVSSGLSWRPGQTIQGPNGFSLDLAGVPQVGDAILVDPTSASAIGSNNGNALSMVALRDAALADGHNITDTWALALSDVGVRVQSGATAASISGAAASQAEQLRSSQSGVNLDEEAARLIQYQQSYQAAAKVLQIAQSLFDSVLQAAGR